MNKINYILILIIFSCSKILLSYNHNQDKWVNIIVHGSIGLRSNFNLCTFRRLVRDKIEGSIYERNVLAIRNNKYLFTMQPIQELGLRPVYSDCSHPCGPYVFVNLYEKIRQKYFPGQENKFYTFGWSGLVSFKQRFKEAIILYKALREQLIYKNYKIRIIGYSHGANLAFNLAAVRELYFPQDNFEIDEVVAIGMPVLSATEHLVCHPIFKKIYHIYSQSDIVQLIDIFSPCNIISHKAFSKNPPKKLIQIEIQITSELLRVPNMPLPRWQSGIINQSPGHMELWFFGWGPSGYRRNIALYPLPFSVFIPYLLFISQNYACCSNFIRLNIYPAFSTAVMQTDKQYYKTSIPFISCPELNLIKQYACRFHPESSKYINKYLELKKYINPETYK